MPHRLAGGLRQVRRARNVRKVCVHFCWHTLGARRREGCYLPFWGGRRAVVLIRRRASGPHRSCYGYDA